MTLVVLRCGGGVCIGVVGNRVGADDGVMYGGVIGGAGGAFDIGCVGYGYGVGDVCVSGVRGYVVGGVVCVGGDVIDGVSVAVICVGVGCRRRRWWYRLY